MNELCERLRARLGRGGATEQRQFVAPCCAAHAHQHGAAEQQAAPWHPEDFFDVEVFALHAGFGSAARLRRACLNVFGKTLRRLEEILAEEVLQFYLCAEDKALREIASRENEIAVVFRARELYHRSEDPPKAPFLDEWSKFEELRAHWLSRMREMMS